MMWISKGCLFLKIDFTIFLIEEESLVLGNKDFSFFSVFSLPHFNLHARICDALLYSVNFVKSLRWQNTQSIFSSFVCFF